MKDGFKKLEEKDDELRGLITLSNNMSDNEIKKINETINDKIRAFINKEKATTSNGKV